MNRIKELRKEKGWSLSELGERLHVDKTTVSRYESEKLEFTSSTIHILCDLFSCTADYLLGRSLNREPIISDDHVMLLEAFDNSPNNMKEGIMVFLSPYMKSIEKKKA